jgi:uncharacterized SAM-binding protein YcdF (DUF218 family)
MVLIGASGFIIFSHAPIDPLQRVDAIVVLGGEHDGREDYGVSLAREGWAPTVLLSNPYGPGDPVMRRVCSESDQVVEVLCVQPQPLTTRGEAEMTRRLANEHSWKKIIVVSWRYHLPRARFIFDQCFSDQDGAVLMRAVPRRYDESVLSWEFTYMYQYGGLVKAMLQGDCA